MIPVFFYIFSLLSAPYPAANYQTHVTDIPLRELTSDSTVTLQQISGNKGLVVIFVKKNCPYNKYYEERINTLMDTYSSKGINFAKICYRDTVKRTSDGFFHLYDGENIVQELLGAEKSPEVFLFSNLYNNIRVVYHGAIDNNPLLPSDVSRSYLREAIQNLLNRRKQNPITTSPYGCYLKN